VLLPVLVNKDIYKRWPVFIQLVECQSKNVMENVSNGTFAADVSKSRIQLHI